MNNSLLNEVKERVKFWWVSLLVGILTLLVGVWSAAAPLSTLGVLTIIFIASLIANGAFDIIFSIINRKNLNGWGWTLALGILSFIFGFILITKPIESILVLAYLAGFWMMFVSITSISGSIEMQRVGIKGWGWMLAFGIVGVIFSFLLIANPAFAAAYIAILFSISLILYGAIRRFFAFKLRKINKTLNK